MRQHTWSGHENGHDYQHVGWYSYSELDVSWHLLWFVKGVPGQSCLGAVEKLGNTWNGPVNQPILLFINPWVPLYIPLCSLHYSRPQVCGFGEGRLSVLCAPHYHGWRHLGHGPDKGVHSQRESEIEMFHLRPYSFFVLVFWKLRLRLGKDRNVSRIGHKGHLWWKVNNRMWYTDKIVHFSAASDQTVDSDCNPFSPPFLAINISALPQAACLPMSIIIVGVGPAEFDGKPTRFDGWPR